jgi:hypothetical protein
MEPPTYFLCASCGCEVRVDYCSPWFGLCEFCEEQCRETVVSWPVSRSTPGIKEMLNGRNNGK